MPLQVVSVIVNWSGLAPSRTTPVTTIGPEDTLVSLKVWLGAVWPEAGVVEYAGKAHELSLLRTVSGSTIAYV